MGQVRYTVFQTLPLNAPPSFSYSLFKFVSEATDRKHIFTVMVQLDVVAAAEPPHVQGFIVSVVMSIDLGCATDLASLLFQSA